MRLTRETAHQIGDNPQLMGILSLPSTDKSSRETAVVIFSAGLLHRTGPFRLHVDLARRLAASGFATLRLDQAGRGDSSRSEGLTSQETVQQELSTALEFIRAKTGIEKLIIIGLCSGADDALQLTEHHEEIVGVVLYDGFAERTSRYYVTYYLRRIASPARLMTIIRARIRRLQMRFSVASPSADMELAELPGIRNFPNLASAKSAFGELFDRGGAALCVFTAGIEDYYCQLGQLRRNLGLKNADDRLTEVYYARANHTYPFVAHREKLVQLTCEWCTRNFE